MEAPEDDDLIILDRVEECIGKPVDHSLPNLAVNLRETGGKAEHGRHGDIHSARELGTQAWRSFLVPVSGLENIEPGFRPKPDSHQLRTLQQFAPEGLPGNRGIGIGAVGC